jgi:ribose/xylose/arabinose/galactoside ABC-type transport system permease subunit/ABC-type multidrug transport system ATPase subunit
MLTVHPTESKMSSPPEQASTPPRSGVVLSSARMSFLDWIRWRSATIPGEASGRLGLGLVAIALFVLFSITAPGYLSISNLSTIGLSMAPLLIAVIGAMMMLTAGTIDISIGAIFALAGVTAGQVAVLTYNSTLAFFTGVAVGAFLGLLNGVTVRLIKLNPFIVTLATMIIYGGVAFVVSQGLPISGFPDSFTGIGRLSFGGISLILIIAVVIFGVGSFIITRSRHGLRLYAIGGDERAAVASGVNAGRTVVVVFVINGALIGLASTLMTARIGIASPTAGGLFIFDVLTAAILGGVAFAGGGGRPAGVLVGVATIGILKSGLIFLGVPSYWQDVATGGMLIAAIIADEVLQSARDQGGFIEMVRRHFGAKQVATGIARSTGEGPGEYERVRGGARAAMSPVPVLEARGLRREFGAIKALRGVDISVRAGEVVCLVGDNGAGKSSVIKLLSGIDKPDGGTISLNGEPVTFSNSQDAQRAGVRTVYQDLALVPSLSVAHNFELGNEPIKKLLGFIPVRDEKEAERRTRTALADLGIEIEDVFSSVRRKSGGQRQALAIARATGSGAPVVILDEPTAALGVKQTQLVLRAIGRLADRGAAVILITHDIKSVFALADTVVVLRLGQVSFSGPVSELDEHSLISLMAGL